MQFPATSVMTRTEWSHARDKAGGSSGLTKINLGDKLDAHHKAHKAAGEHGDEAHQNALVKATAELANALTSYGRELGSEHKPVQGIVTTIAHQAEQFTKDLGEYVKHWETEYGTALTRLSDAGEKLEKATAEMKAGLKRFYQRLLDRDAEMTDVLLEGAKIFAAKLQEDLKHHASVQLRINQSLTTLDDHFGKALAFAKAHKAGELRTLEQHLASSAEAIKDCQSRFLTIGERFAIIEKKLGQKK